MSLLEEKDTVIVKFKYKSKSDVIFQLNFFVMLFVLESMCQENHQLAYKCRQLKSAGKVHSTWIWNNSVNVKLDETGHPAKILCINDIEKLLGVDN